MFVSELIDLIKEYPCYKVCYYVDSAGYSGVEVYDAEKDNVSIDHTNKLILLNVSC